MKQLITAGSVGAWLKELRTRRGLSLREVVRGTGINLTSLINWELGRYHPTLRHLVTVLDFYGKDLVVQDREDGVDDVGIVGG